MVRAVVGNAAFRIIVPDMAKSAGTLMTFGADQILMSDTSELGPIDPQIPHVGASGELRRLSVLTYIKAYEEWKDALDANGNDVTACIMMSKLDPATLRHYRFVADRARNLAENLLKQGIFRLIPGNYTQIPADFMNLDQFSTHGQVIDAQDALRIGLNIEVLDPPLRALGRHLDPVHPPADGPRGQQQALRIGVRVPADVTRRGTQSAHSCRRRTAPPRGLTAWVFRAQRAGTMNVFTLSSDVASCRVGDTSSETPVPPCDSQPHGQTTDK